MKFVFSLIGIAFMALTPAQADTTQAENCTSISKMAESIMRARQAGMPMHEAMAIPAKLGEGASEPQIAVLVKLAQQMVIVAYEQPGYMTDAMRNQAVTDFGNEVYLTCIKD